MDFTGVDYLQPIPRTKVVYWLHKSSTLERIRVVVYVPTEGAVPSVVSLWEGADWYERELFDLLGIFFKGHPLRKDYALTEEPVEFKNGINPKVPSETIPHLKS